MIQTIILYFNEFIKYLFLSSKLIVNLLFESWFITIPILMFLFINLYKNIKENKECFKIKPNPATKKFLFKMEGYKFDKYFIIKLIIGSTLLTLFLIIIQYLSLDNFTLTWIKLIIELICCGGLLFIFKKYYVKK